MLYFEIWVNKISIFWMASITGTAMEIALICALRRNVFLLDKR
jgi:hypothetical protein